MYLLYSLNFGTLSQLSLRQYGKSTQTLESIKSQEGSSQKSFVTSGKDSKTVKVQEHLFVLLNPALHSMLQRPLRHSSLGMSGTSIKTHRQRSEERRVGRE